MGPLSPSQPVRILTHLLLAAVIGGLLSLSLVCDGATVGSLVTPVPATPEPLTAGPKTDGPKMPLSTPQTNTDGPKMPLSTPQTNGTNTTSAASEEEEEKAGPVVEQHPPKEKAVEGEDVRFSCLLKEADPEGVVVHWIHQGPESEHTVLEGNQTSEDQFADRAFLSGDLGHGDFSMTLLNVSVEDRGVYRCVLTLSDGDVQGSGTKLSIRKDTGLLALEESVGTIIGVTVAAVGVAIGLVALILTQFRDKLNCLQK